MRNGALIGLVTLGLTGCVVLPVEDNSYSKQCGLSSNKKVLKIVDFAKDTDSYYTISGYVLTPIILPSSAIISGTYVAVNNTFYVDDKKIECAKSVTEPPEN